VTRGKVTVTVAPGSVVYLEGHGHAEGAVLEVTAADAKALEGQGVVTS
jgi:hypothetical protein